MGKQPYKLGQEAPPPPPYLHTQMVCGGFSKLNATLEVALDVICKKKKYKESRQLQSSQGANNTETYLPVSSLLSRNPTDWLPLNTSAKLTSYLTLFFFFSNPNAQCRSTSAHTLTVEYSRSKGL